jgi:transcriptional regulator with XRE-family HTH domain
MSKYAASKIGQQLQQAREARGLSVAGAAGVLGVKRQMVYNYEKGRSLPSLDVLVRATKAWGTLFELDGCTVLPPDSAKLVKRPPPIQGVLPFQRPRVYRKASVKIRQRRGELIITAVVRNGL